MSDEKNPVNRREITTRELYLCLFMAALFLFVGIEGIYSGTVRVGGTRHTPGTPVYGAEAITVAVLYIVGASLLLLWLCRHRSWLFLAIVAAMIVNVIVAITAFHLHP